MSSAGDISMAVSLGLVSSGDKPARYSIDEEAFDAGRRPWSAIEQSLPSCLIPVLCFLSHGVGVILYEPGIEVLFLKVRPSCCKSMLSLDYNLAWFVLNPEEVKASPGIMVNDASIPLCFRSAGNRPLITWIGDWLKCKPDIVLSAPME